MTIAFHIAAWIALAIVAILIFLILFEPGLAYRISAPDEPLDSHEFLGLVTALVDAQLLGHSRVDVLTDGRTFYASELAAIRGARHSVHIESYVFRPGRVSERFLDALSERARAGVAVRLIVDAIGSFPMQHASFAALRAAGGEVFRYCPIRWYTLKRFNNRTHREIIVVDGTIGFAGGAGMADWWAGENEPGQDGGGRPWRDSMIRIEGELVGGLQTTFVENWLEASGEALSGVEHFPFCRADRAAPVAGHVTGLVVSSTPSAGRATRARMLFQLLMASARECIEICSPYFIPDRSMRQELVRAAMPRGDRPDHCARPV
jgi:cardiolipin synthase